MMSGTEKAVLKELLRVPGIAEVIEKDRAAKLKSRTNGRIKTLEEIERIEPDLSAKQSELEKAQIALQQARQQAEEMIDRAAIAARKIEQECHTLSSKLHHATNTLNREHREDDIRVAANRLEAEIQNRRGMVKALTESIAMAHPIMPFRYALNPPQRAEKKRRLEKCEQKILALEGALAEVKKLRRAHVSPDYITEAVAAALSVIKGG